MNPRHRRHAFTLLEMLLATALAAVLMGGILMMLLGVSRDRRRLTASVAQQPRETSLIERLRWDLVNAQTMSQARGSGATLTLIGHCGIDPATLAGNGRLVQVTYRRIGDGVDACLIREQEYLDDAARPQRWRELVACGVEHLIVLPESSDSYALEIGGETRSVPSRLRVQIDRGGSHALSEELWVK